MPIDRKIANVARYMSAQEFADVTYRSVRRIHNMAQADECEVTPIRIGKRLLFPRGEVMAWLESLEADRSR